MVTVDIGNRDSITNLDLSIDVHRPKARRSQFIRYHQCPDVTKQRSDQKQNARVHTNQFHSDARASMAVVNQRLGGKWPGPWSSSKSHRVQISLTPGFSPVPSPPATTNCFNRFQVP